MNVQDRGAEDGLFCFFNQVHGPRWPLTAYKTTAIENITECIIIAR